MRMLICGGRYFNDRERLEGVLDGLCEELTEPRILLHGDSMGADTLADRWARKRGIAVWLFPADWERYGRAAGPIRNEAMIERGRPDLVIAFPGGVAELREATESLGEEILRLKAKLAERERIAAA
jgi:hypothetical protein